MVPRSVPTPTATVGEQGAASNGQLSEFGDYDVSIEVPEGFVVTATGELGNPDDVLTASQRGVSRRRSTPRTSRPPRPSPTNSGFDLEAEGGGGRRTAFPGRERQGPPGPPAPSSPGRLGVPVPGTDDVTMAMSFFPNEGEPLWSRYSTRPSRTPSRSTRTTPSRIRTRWRST